MKKKLITGFVCLGVVLLANSCKKSSRFEINVKENRYEVKFQRFDKDLIQLDTTSTRSITALYKKYPDFVDAYTADILNTPSNDTSAVKSLFGKFLRDTTFSKVNKSALATFTNVNDIEQQVSDAYTYIHHYFPEVKLPEVYLFVSGLNRSVMMTDKFIGVGTDFYLGRNYPVYKDFTYQYLIYNMRRECMAADIVSATLFRMFVRGGDQDRLLDNMLFRGKVIYLLSVFMPELKPEEVMGYTPEQMEWCTKNEKAIWTAIIDQKDLFSTETLLIRKYLNDAPFTAPVSQKSPGRVGTWVGWQIVKSYMDKNQNITLRDLMKDNNFQQILEKSGYRP